MNKLVSIIIILICLLSCKRPVRQGVELQKNNTSTESVVHSSDKPIVHPDEELEGKQVYEVKVIRIVDGDTAELLYGEMPIMLRFEHIDGPEKRGKQPFGNKAKQQLSELCFGQLVSLVTEGEFDMGGRIIGVIINEHGVNVNKEMVRLGYAWHFKKYSSDMSYDTLETEARNYRRGLWRDEHPVAPWDFR